MRSWIELGRMNNMEVTYPAKSERSLRSGHECFHPSAFTHLDAGQGQKVRGNFFGDVFEPFASSVSGVTPKI